MNKNVLKIAIPSIFANITLPLVGMVDLAIAGRLGDASLIGAIAIATMLFDLLYWNMGFLRVGTGGLIAQAYGRRDFKSAMKVFTQGIATAFVIALLIWAIQYIFIEAAFYFIECSPEVETLARDYFFIRIWAAPATLSLFVFKGFFIGMQNAISPMVVDLTVNFLNLAASLFFALYIGMGFNGIAMGTVIAQYAGMILSFILIFTYYKKLIKYINISESIKLKEIGRFFAINANLFVRSICFLFIYAGFTSLSAKYGDIPLAAGSIIMKLMLFYSYFIDGFAYAGEALAGKYIGAKEKILLSKAINVIFKWCIVIGILSTVVFTLWSIPMCRLMTNSQEVLDEISKFLPWLLVMPILSCLAFTWDGIFIGATATKAIRNSMIYAVIGFFICYFTLNASWGIHSLWCGYIAHVVIRAAYLTFTAKKEVYIKAHR